MCVKVAAIVAKVADMLVVKVIGIIKYLSYQYSVKIGWSKLLIQEQKSIVRESKLPV